MRKSLAAIATAACLVAGASAANAGYTEYTICWTAPTGASDCAELPRNYSLPGLAKPRPSGGRTSFVLTWSLIACLRPYVRTDTMRPYHDATIYAPKT